MLLGIAFCQPASGQPMDCPPLSNNLYFAQFANGGGVTSAITLTNPSGTIAVTMACIELRDDTGALITSVPLIGQPLDRVPSNFGIPPRGAVTFSSNGQGNLLAGSVRVVSSGPLGGVLLYATPELSTGVGESSPVAGFITPVTQEGARRTGLAIRNLTGNALTLTITLRGSDGVAIGQPVTSMLSARGHVARFVDEFFPSIPASFQGTVEVSSSGGANSISATALRFGGGVFTTLPVTPLQ
jgi:hypothetical protein